MKTKIIFMAMSLITLNACKKQPEACIDGPLSVAEGETPSYTWCGTNAGTIEWRYNSERGNGNSYTPAFKNRGTYFLEVNAKNGNKQDTKSITIEYGKTSLTSCTISDYCSPGSVNYNANFDFKYYKAFLYNSKSDWVSDVANGAHALAIDSTTCQFSTKDNSAAAFFTKSYTVGAGRIISIEYINPSDPSKRLSNWIDIFYNSTTLEIINAPYVNNICQTRLAEYTKLLFQGTWKLSSSFLNGNTVAIPSCNQDDFIKFKADGTWTYNTGADKCNNTSLPSNGSFGNVPSCSSYLSFYLTGISGPFSGGACELNGNSLKVNIPAGPVTGYYTFTHQP